MLRYLHETVCSELLEMSPLLQAGCPQSLPSPFSTPNFAVHSHTSYSCCFCPVPHDCQHDECSTARVLPPGFYRQGSTSRVLPPGFYLQGSTARVLPLGFYRQGSTSRVLPPGFYRHRFGRANSYFFVVAADTLCHVRVNVAKVTKMLSSKFQKHTVRRNCLSRCVCVCVSFRNVVSFGMTCHSVIPVALLGTHKLLCLNTAVF